MSLREKKKKHLCYKKRGKKKTASATWKKRCSVIQGKKIHSVLLKIDSIKQKFVRFSLLPKTSKQMTELLRGRVMEAFNEPKHYYGAYLS